MKNCKILIDEIDGKQIFYLPTDEWNIFGTDKDDEQIVLGRGARKKLEPNIFVTPPELLYQLPPYELFDLIMPITAHGEKGVIKADMFAKQLYATESIIDKLAILKAFTLFLSPLFAYEGLVDPTKQYLVKQLASYGPPNNVGIDLLQLALPTFIEIGQEKTKKELEYTLERMPKQKKEMIDELARHFETKPLNIVYTAWVLRHRYEDKFFYSQNEAEKEIKAILHKIDKPEFKTVVDALAYMNSFRGFRGRELQWIIPDVLGSIKGKMLMDEMGYHIVDSCKNAELMTNEEYSQIHRHEILCKLLYPSVYTYNALREKSPEIDKLYDYYVNTFHL